MRKGRTLIKILGFGAVSLMGAASADPVVRLWEGHRAVGVSTEAFRSFLTQVLFPTTITANPKSIQAYLPIVLDPNQPLPSQAWLTAVPFDEAALVIHRDKAAYDAARAENPWYGPAHFLEGGGFDKNSSYSATPISYAGQIEIANAQRKVGYDLRHSNSNWVADWQEGYVLVSVVLRKNTVGEDEFREAAALYSTRVSDALKDGLDGHFIRVGPGHILEYIRFKGQADYERGLIELNAISRAFESQLIFDYFRELADAVPHGQAAAPDRGAFNIRFSRPFIQCSGVMGETALAARPPTR